MADAAAAGRPLIGLDLLEPQLTRPPRSAVMAGLGPRLSGRTESVVAKHLFSNPESRCPGLSRASMSFLVASKGVDRRVKPGDDDPRWALGQSWPPAGAHET